MKKLLLPKPVKFRRSIPFFCEKTETAFKKDKYENYEEVVTRQIRLHLADDARKVYPFQPILDWIFAEIQEIQPLKIVDIGCGVGRLIGELSIRFPDAECWGIDYSYQLLRQANDYWIAGKSVALNDGDRGFEPLTISGKALKNLHFGLAKGEELPFENGALDLVCSNFTLDRFDDPILALSEIFRVLNSTGKALIVSPLNFQKKEHWQQFLPTKRLLEQVQEMGFIIENYDDNKSVFEPLDGRGNGIVWQCLFLHLRKP